MSSMPSYILDYQSPKLSDVSKPLFGLVICLAVFILLQKRKNRRFEKLVSKFPGPISRPLIGNALEFLNHNPEDIFFSINRFGKIYGSPFRLWLGHKLCIIIAKPEDLQIVLNSPKTFEKDVAYRFVMPTVGTALITAPAEKWKRTRKAIVPSFTPKLLKRLLPVMNERIGILVQKLQQQSGSNSEVDVFPYFCTLSIDTFMEAAFGVQTNTQLDEGAHLVAAIARMIKLHAARIYKPWLHPDFIYNRTKYAKQLDDVNDIIREFTKNVLEKRKKQLEEKRADSVNENDVDDNSKFLLDILFDLHDSSTFEFSDEDLMDEAVGFLIGSSDNSAITASFCLLLLAMHPESQAKVFEEQYNIFGRSNRPASPEDLDDMKYTEQVLKETLRMFPTVPVQLRAVKEDLKLSGNYVLPVGATVMIAPMITHANPDLWPEPEKFNPDNFSTENLENKHKYAFVPFSGGPKLCIGYKYAMMTMKTWVSTVVRNFKLSTTASLENMKLSIDVQIRKKDGWNVKFEPRIYPEL